jgi:hypothetical protein
MSLLPRDNGRQQSCGGELEHAAMAILSTTEVDYRLDGNRLYLEAGELSLQLEGR